MPVVDIQRSGGPPIPPESTGRASIKLNSTTGFLQFNDGTNIRDVATLDQTQTYTGAASFTGNSITGVVVAKTVSFTEAGVAGVYTGAVTIPAGSTILNIQFISTVLWGAGTDAVLKIGDSFDDDGWITACSLKATDLLVGEVLDISNAENWGGKQGAYLVAATGRKGSVQAGQGGVYYGVADTVTGIVTTTGTTSSVGRSFMTVTYAVGQVTAATKV